MRKREQLLQSNDGDVVDLLRRALPGERVINLARAQNHAFDLAVRFERNVFVTRDVVSRVAVGDDAPERRLRRKVHELGRAVLVMQKRFGREHDKWF